LLTRVQCLLPTEKTQTFIYQILKGLSIISKRGTTVKKAQANASGAAVLVAAIAALLIAYILFLPPADRNALLGDGGSTGGTGGTGGGTALSAPVKIIEEKIGQVSLARTNTIEHAFLATRITTQTNAREIKKVDSLYVRRGTFEEEMKDVKFTVDTGLTDDLKLSFTVNKGKGRLIILLNNQEIYNAEVTGAPEPITLDKSNIAAENTLTFKASTPGGAFWTLNEYDLKDVLVSGAVHDVSKSAAEQHFSVSQNEYDTLDKAELKFTPACDARYASTLNVFINGENILSQIPQCKSVNTIEVAKERLAVGDNTLAFQSYGVYDLSAIKVKSTLTKPVDPVVYFDIPPQYYDGILRRNIEAFVYLDFTDDTTLKEGTVTLNGHKANFKTNSIQYALRVSSYLKEGTNSIIISPVSDTLNIATLTVELR
jgi:hypothetical protein